MHLQSQLALTFGQHTLAGLKAVNEDCIGIKIPIQPALTLKGVVAVIADGVSAAEAGKEASEMCVSNFISDYYATPDAWSVKTSGQKIILALNRWLVGQSQIKAHVSTLSALIIKSQTAYIFHVGDTRIYRLRKGHLECLTNDHSLNINKDTVYLSRAMGMDNHIEVDYQKIDTEQGDVFFLSSDGVHDFIPHKELQHILFKNVASYSSEIASNNYHHVCAMLVEKALAAGSGDNLSCQILKIDGLPDGNNQEVYERLAHLPFPSPLNVGQSLDNLTVIRVLHESSRSQVYLVKNNKSIDATTEKKNLFILKTPSINFDDDPAYIERFVLEQWIGKRIDSPFVVKIIEPEHKTALYTLMEFIDGITLEEWIKENPKPELSKVIHLAELISRGLRALHRKDILHQDIKPDNIIIDRNGFPKIIDFGSCYAAGVEEIETPFVREQALGTAIYSAPETRFRMRKTKKSDLFSLAVVVYEMLTGKLPFGDQLEKLQDQRKLFSLEYHSATLYNPMVPPWMDETLKRALSPQPEFRQEALSEFIHDLQRPNKQYKPQVFEPLLHRNPLKFWQGMALLEAFVILLLFYLLNTLS
jgi:serine/threonine protein phosphatase PrpC/predicted Ser/Thr protein kinase